MFGFSMLMKTAENSNILLEKQEFYPYISFFTERGMKASVIKEKPFL